MITIITMILPVANKDWLVLSAIPQICHQNWTPRSPAFRGSPTSQSPDPAAQMMMKIHQKEEKTIESNNNWINQFCSAMICEHIPSQLFFEHLNLPNSWLVNCFVGDGLGKSQAIHIKTRPQSTRDSRQLPPNSQDWWNGDGMGS